MPRGYSQFGGQQSRLIKRCWWLVAQQSPPSSACSDDDAAMWAHLDIAGPVWNDKMGGATGYGVRTLVGLVESMDA